MSKCVMCGRYGLVSQSGSVCLDCDRADAKIAEAERLEFTGAIPIIVDLPEMPH